jgi:hypothetical protein
MDQTTSPALTAILAEMATLTTMERGTLTAEYRTRPAREGEGAGEVRLGPYYKFQVWENGRNASRRVPAAEVPALEEQLAHHRRFAELAAAFVEEAVARSRAPHHSTPAAQEDLRAKKNSGKKPAGKDVRKPKFSSRKSKRG